MGEHSLADVALRAGVDPAYVERLVELDILRAEVSQRFSEADVRRVRWVKGLERAGVPLDGLAAAVRSGKLSFSFLDAEAYDRFPGLSPTTFGQLSADTGLSMELLSVLREARGSAEPRPDDQVREDELLLVPAIELMISSGYRPGTVERWLRACGDSMRRIVETETDAYVKEVMQRLVDAGMSESEMLDTQAELGSRLVPLVDHMLLAIYHGQQEHAWIKSIVEAVEAALERAGLHSRLRRPPAMCFLDVTGYTRLTEERGDEAAADLATRLATMVRRSSQDHGGQPVKWLGDGVMFFFPDPGASVVAALEMSEGMETHALPPAHVGIHAGPVVFHEGDYYGRTVNVAARIAEYARPGEVLVSQEVVEAAGGAAVTFSEVGPVQLKGVSGAVRLHVARRRLKF